MLTIRKPVNRGVLLGLVIALTVPAAFFAVISLVAGPGAQAQVQADIVQVTPEGDDHGGEHSAGLVRLAPATYWWSMRLRRPKWGTASTPRPAPTAVLRGRCPRSPDSPPKIVGMAFVGLQQVWGVNRGVDRTLRGVSERIGNG